MYVCTCVCVYKHIHNPLSSSLNIITKKLMLRSQLRFYFFQDVYSATHPTPKVASPPPSTLWVCVSTLGHVGPFVTSQTVAHQAPLSTGFPRQECWSRLPLPSPGDFPNPRDRIHVSCIAGGSSATEGSFPSREVLRPLYLLII